MRRFKTWLLERFLPAWAKDTVYQENKALREEVQRLNAYIDGMENALRFRTRIALRNEVTHEHLERTE